MSRLGVDTHVQEFRVCPLRPRGSTSSEGADMLTGRPRTEPALFPPACGRRCPGSGLWPATALNNTLCHALRFSATGS